MDNRIRIINTADSIMGSTHDGTIKMNDTLAGTYKVLEFYMTNSLYNVNSNNNKVYFDESAILKTATLTNGYYTGSQLATQLQTQMNTAGANTYTITFSGTTYKFSISSTGNFGFQFATNISSSARKLLGYSLSNKTEATTSTSDNVVDLNPIKCIFFDFESDIRKDIELSVNIFSIAINDKSTFGELIKYKLNENYVQKIKFNHKKEIRFRLYDQSLNGIDINGVDWYLTIVIDKD